MNGWPLLGEWGSIDHCDGALRYFGEGSPWLRAGHLAGVHIAAVRGASLEPAAYP